VTGRRRIIDGDLYDAKAEAERLLAEARAEVDRLRADIAAESQAARDVAAGHAESLVASAAAELAQARAVADAVRAAASAGSPGAAPELGRVTEVTGLVIRAEVPGLRLGEVVRIDRSGPSASPGDSGIRAPLDAEVVGFRGEDVVLLPLGELTGVAPASAVLPTGAPLAIRCGDDLRGRVLDGLGRPLDGGPPLTGERWSVDRAAPAALDRPLIDAPLATGVRALDGFCTLGEGQRVGLFAGSGVGKSTLLGQIARGAAADVVVACLVGERGRELGELLSGPLGAARDRTVVVCATSDAPSLVRVRAVQVATAVAEWFRDRRGARVLLLVDSLTRVARAQREVGLAAGEPPARHGYPPSVFALLPRLVERAGRTRAGSITGVYTVLVAGGDMDEPIADEVRGIVDGHVVLERRLAARGHFPPIDVLASVSRVMDRVTTPAHRAAAAAARQRLAIYEEHRDLITLGAYKAGTNRTVDDAVAHQVGLDRFLRQDAAQRSDLDQTVAKLVALSS
jgi:type III secretion protein N (ATPase)